MTPSDASARRRVSMGDVASLAGVSAQTVSRVANGYAGVLDATRDDVLRAMRELDYRPNGAARALKRGHFRAIGVVLFTLATTGNARTLEAITEEAARSGYAVTLIPVASPTLESVHGAFTRLGDLAVDAAILLMEVRVLDASRIHLPDTLDVVIADSEADDRFAVVDTDQATGTVQAVEHLLALGHPTVHHLAGPEASFAATRREEAWRRTLQQRGAIVPDVERGDWTPESGRAAAALLLADPACTALFCANDEMALGALSAAHALGLRVPEDLSIVGFDDITTAASFLPPLTTVHQNFAEVGRRCVERVLHALDGDRERGASLVPTSLVVRESTAPYRARMQPSTDTE